MSLRSLAAVGVVASLALAACGSSDKDSAADTDQAPKTLRIGFSGTTSGPYAAYDAPTLAGLRFAAEQVNEKGKLEVKIDFRDNGGDQGVSATDLQGMLDSGIKLFVLTTGPPQVAQGLQVSEAGGISTLGAGTVPSVLRDIGDRAFLFAFGDNAQSAAVAQYACEQGYRRVFSLTSAQHVFTSSNPKYFKDAFAHICDGRVVGTAEFKLGANDYSTQVAKAKSAGDVDAIFSAMFVPDSGVFLKQLRGAGVDTPFLGLDGNDTPLYAKGGGSAVDGSVYATHAQDPKAGEEFKRDYEASTGSPPESFLEALGRDAVYIYADALKRAGSTDADALLKALDDTKDLALVSSAAMTMNAKTHIPDKEVAIIRMDGTKPTLVKAFLPEYVPSP